LFSGSKKSLKVKKIRARGTKPGTKAGASAFGGQQPATTPTERAKGISSARILFKGKPKTIEVCEGIGFQVILGGTGKPSRGFNGIPGGGTLVVTFSFHLRVIRSLSMARGNVGKTWPNFRGPDPRRGCTGRVNLEGSRLGPHGARAQWLRGEDGSVGSGGGGKFVNIWNVVLAMVGGRRGTPRGVNPEEKKRSMGNGGNPQHRGGDFKRGGASGPPTGCNLRQKKDSGPTQGGWVWFVFGGLVRKGRSGNYGWCEIIVRDREKNVGPGGLQSLGGNWPGGTSTRLWIQRVR